MLQRVRLVQSFCRPLHHDFQAVNLRALQLALISGPTLHQFATHEGAKHFSLQQPPYRLAIMCPHANVDIAVVTGDFESIQVSCMLPSHERPYLIHHLMSLPLMLQIQENQCNGSEEPLGTLHQGSTVSKSYSTLPPQHILGGDTTTPQHASGSADRRAQCRKSTRAGR